MFLTLILLGTVGTYYEYLKKLDFCTMINYP